jgi:signal transduction histidine kinase
VTAHRLAPASSVVGSGSGLSAALPALVETVPEMIQVNVIDDGIGIASKDRGKIFDRFFRSDHPLVQETTGTGLGLSITKSLIEMHGGSLWVESEPGDGSTFGFTLPVAAFENE